MTFRTVCLLFTTSEFIVLVAFRCVMVRFDRSLFFFSTDQNLAFAQEAAIFTAQLFRALARVLMGTARQRGIRPATRDRDRTRDRTRGQSLFVWDFMVVLLPYPFVAIVSQPGQKVYRFKTIVRNKKFPFGSNYAK